VKKNRESKLYASRPPEKHFHQCIDLKFHSLSRCFEESLVHELTPIGEYVVSLQRDVSDSVIKIGGSI
jgi:hypothetical protein